MKCLLDTHAWLWMVARPEQLSARVRAYLAAPELELLLSHASVWEISIKNSIGKLDFGEPVESFVASRTLRDGVDLLPIEWGHIIQTNRVPLHHRDPFDRMIIAQAQVESLPIVTADRAFGDYEVDVIW